MQILLGIDLGQKRTGFAWCGPAGMVETLGTAPAGELEQAMRRYAEEVGAELLVFGLPLRRGRIGSAARVCRRRAYALAEALDLPLVFVDEAHTTDEAKQLFPGRDKDAVAAALILSRYLADGAL